MDFIFETTGTLILAGYNAFYAAYCAPHAFTVLNDTYYSPSRRGWCVLSDYTLVNYQLLASLGPTTISVLSSAGVIPELLLSEVHSFHILDDLITEVASRGPRTNLRGTLTNNWRLHNRTGFGNRVVTFVAEDLIEHHPEEARRFRERPLARRATTHFSLHRIPCLKKYNYDFWYQYNYVQARFYCGHFSNCK